MLGLRRQALESLLAEQRSSNTVPLRLLCDEARMDCNSALGLAWNPGREARQTAFINP